MKYWLIIYMSVTSLITFASECETQYRTRAKNKRDKLNRQMERYYLGSWIQIGNQHVHLQDKGSNPQDFYNNFEEDILLIMDKNLDDTQVFNHGVKAIYEQVNKKVMASYQDIQKAIKHGVILGDFCQGLFAPYRRNRAAKYVIKFLKQTEDVAYGSREPSVVDTSLDLPKDSLPDEETKNNSQTHSK
jgi:hypothetical protein